MRAKSLQFQKQHNEENKVGKLELVLFEYALEHLLRINRVINQVSLARENLYNPTLSLNISQP